jgi:hypothetical protein
VIDRRVTSEPAAILPAAASVLSARIDTPMASRSDAIL